MYWCEICRDLHTSHDLVEAHMRGSVVGRTNAKGGKAKNNDRHIFTKYLVKLYTFILRSYKFFKNSN